MPKNWKDFLRVDQNKTEVFGVLSREAIRLPIADGKEKYATCGTEVMCSPAESDLTSLAPCSHEEADTRMLLHVADAVQKGMRTAVIRTVDTDVVVLAVTSSNNINPDDLLIALGTGSSFRYIAVHRLAATMNPRQTMCYSPHLPCTHRVPHCVFIRWQREQDCLGDLEIVSRGDRCLLERFVVLMYDRTSDIMEVNDAMEKALRTHV